MVDLRSSDDMKFTKDPARLLTEKTRQDLLVVRDNLDGCFGGDCFVGFRDGHSPYCVLLNALFDVVVDGSAWRELNDGASR